MASSDVVMSASDLVGYGKWGELTYQQVWDQEPEYCLWTVAKFQELVKEGDELATKYAAGDSKLKRFCQWVTERDDALAAVEPEFECDSDMEMVEIEKPESGKTLAQRCAKLREANAAKFYGVAAPAEHAGVYSSWADCKPHVFGIKGVLYKSFHSEEEAEEYVSNPPLKASETPEAKAAREAAKAAKDAAAKEAKELKEEARAAKAAETKAAKEQAKAEKAEAKTEVQEAKAAEAARKREGVLDPTAHGQPPKRSRRSLATKEQTPPVVEGDEGQADAEVKRMENTRARSDSTHPEASEAKTSSRTKPSDDKLKKARRAKEAPSRADDKVTIVCNKATAVTPTKVPKVAGEDYIIHYSACWHSVLQRAEELGMKTVLFNLATRPEIISRCLPGEILLDALVKADGLVNKAKAALLLRDPAKEATSPDRWPDLHLPVSPEKHEQERQENQDLANKLKNLSATLLLVATPAKTEDVHMTTGTSPQAGLTDEQLQRIKDNRAHALARKAQVDK